MPRTASSPWTRTTDSLDIFWTGGIVFDFLTKPVDVNHDCIFIHNGFSPDHIIDHLFREDSIDIVHEQLHDGIFFGREDDFYTIFIKPQGGVVVPEGTGGCIGICTVEASFASADQCLDLGTQNNGIKGLGHIIVCADIQTVKGIIVLFSAADNDDGGLDASAAKPLHHRKTIHTVHVHIQQNQIEMGFADHFQGLFSAGGHCCIQSVASNYFIKCGTYRFIIIHDQNQIRHGKFPLYRYSSFRYHDIKYTQFQSNLQGGIAMKSRNVSKLVLVCFVLAVAALLGGILAGVWVFRYFESFVLLYGHYGHLSGVFQETAVFSMISGSLVALGIGILLTLSVHMMRSNTRVQADVEALQKKNQAMEELNRQTQKLAHHQRLEIIGTLTSSIAHEFNNLLTPIMGNSMMALERLSSDEEELYDELLEIYSASCKAKEIISRLSDLSRKNTETCFRPVSPDELIRKMVRTAEPARAENIQINMNLNCWDQRLTANEIQISQLILNLILNGFHAMEPDGGIFTLTTSFDETHIHMLFADTGCGIPKEIQPKIFEPFFTTKETGKGTGLGLAIVAQVVEDHCGKIQVESEAGRGSVFTVSLPRIHTPLAE